jgi:predicted DNA-binding WGR domain protein
MTATVLYRIDPTKRMHRFYRMEIQADLCKRLVKRLSNRSQIWYGQI